MKKILGWIIIASLVAGFCWVIRDILLDVLIAFGAAIVIMILFVTAMELIKGRF